jgi:hypothetical protein
MARLLGDLEKLVAVLRERYNKHVPARDLETEIARKFGVGNLVIKRVKQELDQYGLLKPDMKDFRVWTFPEFLKDNDEKEADDLLGGMKP